MNDEFSYHAVMVLLMLHLACSLEIPVAMFGQGLGPVSDPHLRSVMQQVLPRVDFLGLREGRHSLPLAKSLGVPREKLEVTGDAGLEIAHQFKPAQLESAIGLNVRMTDYSGVDAHAIDQLASVISRAAGQLDAPCIPLPIRIADDGAGDLQATAPILSRCAKVVELPAPISHLADLMPLVARCRTVITGSYHAGVFALAMGIPVVGLAASEYYLHKFQGLADQFPGGCQTIDLRDSTWKQTISTAAVTSYNQAERLRPALLRCAEEQIAACTAAYHGLPSLVGAACVS
jgi:polysaccharide pyruvyl transferase WcaK-like protein